MKSESIDIIRTQIKNRAKFKYPKIRNFNLTDKFIKDRLKEYKGNIDLIVDEVYSIVGDKKSK
jgi:hypothetical protein